MIRLELKGGLGNQMFQYAVARSLASHYDTKLLIRTFSYLFNRKRVCELSLFNIDKNTISSPLWSYFCSKIPSCRVVYNEEDMFHFDENLFIGFSDVLLNGYFQSYKYFEKNEETIREDFVFKKKKSFKTEELARYMKNKNMVSIHVRRSDYLDKKNTSLFYNLTETLYYKKAIDLVQKKTKDAEFIIFSDDIDWCKKELKLEGIYPDWNTGASSWQDMYLMTQSNHNIIANSTYSWWGAWLNNYDKKIVVGPNLRFRKEGIVLDNILPKDWFLC